MATNGITSGKLPAPKGRRTYADYAQFQGDRLLEHDNGEMGHLGAVEAEPITGLSTTDTIRLLGQAGIKVRRGSL